MSKSIKKMKITPFSLLQNPDFFKIFQRKTFKKGFWDLLGVVLVLEKIVFDQKEPFFGKLETFLQHILEYRKKYFSREKDFFVTDLGGLLLSFRRASARRF